MGKSLKLPDMVRRADGALLPPGEFVGRHWKDIKNKYGAIAAVYCSIPDKHLQCYLDAMAGCGFSAAVASSCFDIDKMYLNDFSEDCCSILKDNWGYCSEITNFDVRNWDPPDCDLCFMDCDNFTYRKLENWWEVLGRFGKACHRLMVTDTACFAFKFGTLSKSYGVQSVEEYYWLLSKGLARVNLRVEMVGMFGFASVVLLGHGDPTDIQFLEPIPIEVEQVGEMEGFDF
jgi:hypothetical protein